MIYPNPQIYPHIKAIFVHVPKTAGTEIERALCEKPGQKVGGHTTAEGFRRKFPQEFESFYKFGVVRHPVSRFVSAYRYLRNEPVHRAHNNAEIHKCANFDDWWKQIRQDPGRLNQMVHFQPAHRFLCDIDGTLLVDRICHYETIDQDWEQVSRKLGLTARSLPRINITPKHGLPDETDSRLIEWLVEIYARDFELGGYEVLSSYG